VKWDILFIVVTTARPNAFDIGADENMEKGSTQNSLSINETTTPKRTVIIDPR